MPKREMEPIKFKQIAVGGPDGRELYGLREDGTVFMLHNKGYWAPLVMETPKAPVKGEFRTAEEMILKRDSFKE